MNAGKWNLAKCAFGVCRASLSFLGTCLVAVIFAGDAEAYPGLFKDPETPEHPGTVADGTTGLALPDSWPEITPLRSADPWEVWVLVKGEK